MQIIPAQAGDGSTFATWYYNTADPGQVSRPAHLNCPRIQLFDSGDMFGKSPL
jgi:hypothetical protein